MITFLIFVHFRIKLYSFCSVLYKIYVYRIASTTTPTPISIAIIPPTVPPIMRLLGGARTNYRIKMK